MVPVQTAAEIASFGDCCGAYKFLTKFVILLGELVVEFFPQRRTECGEVFYKMTNVMIAEKEQRTLGISFGCVNRQRKCGNALSFIFILSSPEPILFLIFCGCY